MVTSLAPLTAARAQALMTRLFDEGEFLGPHGIRSLSAAYRGGVTLDVAGVSMSVAYDPSLLTAAPRITAWMVSPSARASSSRFKTTTAAPAPPRVPCAAASNARQCPSGEKIMHSS